MLFSTCPACRQRIRSKARICERCGALTGVSFRSSDEPAIRDWIGAGVIFLFACAFVVVLHTATQEMARPRLPASSLAAR